MKQVARANLLDKYFYTDYSLLVSVVVDKTKKNIEKTVISPLSSSRKERIKKIVRFHYDIAPKDSDINWIDRMLRNNYSVLHDQHIISNLVTVNIGNILLKHRDRIGSIELERLTMNKLLFKYLTFASMCYRASIPLATIFLCRTAIEAGLREKLAEKRAKENAKQGWEEMQDLTGLKLWKLIKKNEDEGIISRDEIEKLFTVDDKMKTIIPNPRNLLDKYIHADLSTIISFLEVIGADTGVIGAEDIMQEKKIQAEAFIDKIAVFVLAATTRLAERLYLPQLR